ncbi:hypothetical protein [Nocardia gipuzkoensis]
MLVRNSLVRERICTCMSIGEGRSLPDQPITRPGRGGTAVEVDRIVGRDGTIHLAGQGLALGVIRPGNRSPKCLDHHLVHVVADGHLVETIPPLNLPNGESVHSWTANATAWVIVANRREAHT